MKPTNEERLIRYLFQPGNGNSFSEREGVFELNFTSGRNYIGFLEKKLGIEFKREWEHTADGNGRYYRYIVADSDTAKRLMNYANLKAEARGEVMFDDETKANILNKFQQAKPRGNNDKAKAE